MIPTSTPPRLILASSSAYRRELLGRLQLPFEVMVPDIDESALPGEAPETTALRLARAKAQAVAARAPGSIVIGSDQVATLDGEQIGKPGNHANALAQLQKMRGRKVVFHTALCLWDGRACGPETDYLRGPGKPALQGRPVTQGCGMPHQFPASPLTGGAQLENIQTLVTLRDLPDAELDAYLRIEQPYDCAGSAKNEGLGIAIIERIDSSDPTALTGLPLIALTGMLRKAGFQFFRKEQD